MVLKTKLDLSPLCALYRCYLFNRCIIIKLSAKNCKKGVKSQRLLKYKPINLILSSLASEFLQNIHIQDFFLGGGGEGLESEGWGQVGWGGKNVKLQK